MNDQFELLPTQGARAVRSGHIGEHVFDALFKAHGVRSVKDNREYHTEQYLWERNDKILVQQWELENGKKLDRMYIDFPRCIRLPIEIKNQMGNGTTDEKLLFTLQRLASVPGTKFGWLILGGFGFSEAAIKAVYDRVHELGRDRKFIVEIFAAEDASRLQKAVGKLVDEGFLTGGKWK